MVTIRELVLFLDVQYIFFKKKYLVDILVGSKLTMVRVQISI